MRIVGFRECTLTFTGPNHRSTNCLMNSGQDAMIVRLGERAELMPGLHETSFKLKEKTKLQREEASGFAEEIKNQMAAKRRLAEERMASKRKSAEASMQGRGSDAKVHGAHEDGDESDDGEDDCHRKRPVASGLLKKKKRKTVFM